MIEVIPDTRWAIPALIGPRWCRSMNQPIHGPCHPGQTDLSFRWRAP